MGDYAIRELLDQFLVFPDKPVEKLDLFLCSNGGDGVLPWRLVPVFRQLRKIMGRLDSGKDGIQRRERMKAP